MIASGGILCHKKCTTYYDCLFKCQCFFYRKKPSDPVTIESVKQFWPQVVDMKNAKHFEKIAEVSIDLAQQLQVIVCVKMQSSPFNIPRLHLG